MSYAVTAQLATGHRVRWAAARSLPAFALGVSVAPLLAVNGGFFSSSWGWSTLLLAWAAILGALFREAARPTIPQFLQLGGLLALAAWTAASMIWTASQTDTMLELQRTLVYVAGAVAALAVARNRAPALLGGVLAGIGVICAYALTTRLFPLGTPYQFYGGVRLSAPVGYWNGLGLVAGMGALLAAVFAAKATSLAARGLAGATLPGLVATLYFTFSRGAWIALFAGCVVLVVIEARRVALVLTVALPAAAAAWVVWQASGKSGLVRAGSTLQQATRDGHSVALTLLLATVVSGAASVVGGLIRARLSVGRIVHGLVGTLLVLVLVVALAGVFSRYGSPTTLAKRGYHSFVNAPAPASSNDINNRLFSLSNNGRVAAWKVAWHAFESEPAIGLGAGTFGLYWDQHRTIDMDIQDAHSLYLETLAELGFVGLALVLVALLSPFIAVRSARSTPAVGGLAVLATYATGAIVDWHWELAGVTLCAVLCGAGAAATATGGPSAAWRRLPLALGGILAVLALVATTEQLLLSSSGRALGAGHYRAAIADAKRARTLAPWSADPWNAIGQAQASAGNRAAAAASLAKAAAKDPNEEERWLNLGIVARGATRRAAFARAQALNPFDGSISVLEQQLGGAR